MINFPKPPPPTSITPATSPSTATIRRCLYRDLDRILPIYNYYISHTIVSLDLDPKPLLYMQRLYNDTLDQDLPFLVVTTNDNHDPAHNKEDDIVGYGYAHYYRRLPAFGGTVEILIYLDHNATGQGNGEKLLKVLIETLRAVTPGTNRDHGIRSALAIVPEDETRDANLRQVLPNFFLKAGFEDRGLLKGVAWKMGKWIDTRTYQLSLHDQPKDKEKAPQKRAPKRRWWSSPFRRR
ncbi:MAG: hypothetical protein ASARMPREDX12_002886 [Alectoria sarmentosa]|nr:MAG: hypothetical protein ASARMPREDX12_002886 [Alectoria sarmentosa]